MAEDHQVLKGRALLLGDRQRGADGRRQRVRHGTRGRRHRQAEPAEVAVLVIVGVPAAVVLLQVERQDRARGERQRLLGREHRLARHVAAAGAGVDAPGGLLLAIDGEGGGAGDPLLLALVVEVLLQVALGIRVIREGLDELHLLALAGRLRTFHFHDELAEGTRSHE